MFNCLSYDLFLYFCFATLNAGPLTPAPLTAGPKTIGINSFDTNYIDVGNTNPRWIL